MPSHRPGYEKYDTRQQSKSTEDFQSCVVTNYDLNVTDRTAVLARRFESHAMPYPGYDNDSTRQPPERTET